MVKIDSGPAPPSKNFSSLSQQPAPCIFSPTIHNCSAFYNLTSSGIKANHVIFFLLYSSSTSKLQALLGFSLHASICSCCWLNPESKRRDKYKTVLKQAICNSCCFYLFSSSSFVFRVTLTDENYGEELYPVS